MKEFMDEEGAFSLKSICETGKQLFKKDVGDWYGVNSISKVIHHLNSTISPFPNFKTIVFNDGLVILN